MKKIVLITGGTRGDVQPVLSFALYLRERGYHCKMVIPKSSRDFVKPFGIETDDLPIDFKEILRSEKGANWLKKGRFISTMRAYARLEYQARHEIQDKLEGICRAADLIICNPIVVHWVQPLCERYSIPLMVSTVFPFGPKTREFTNVLFKSNRIPAFLNQFSHQIFHQAHWLASKKSINEWRQKLGLKKQTEPLMNYIERLGIPVLNTFHANLVPVPADWSNLHHITGYWILEDEYQDMIPNNQPSQVLKDWLSAGPPPIFWGFGSMPVSDQSLIDIIRTINARLGTRSIIGAGWSHLGEKIVEKDLLTIDSVNHAWLFPQCACTVHHGGSGTTHASLLAGLPTLICPVIMDQFFWGKVVMKQQVGLRLPFQEMNTQRLSEALQKLLSKPYKDRARKLGMEMQQVNGLANSLQILEKQLKKGEAVTVA